MFETPPPSSTHGADAVPRLASGEAEVLCRAAKGQTNRDIGDILGASPSTVKKHLERVYAKLGAETRTAAAAVVAMRLCRPETARRVIGCRPISPIECRFVTRRHLH